MIIYRFKITHDGRTEEYKIDSAYKSKGYRSNYERVETWELIRVEDGRIIKTAYGKGIANLEKLVNELKDQADKFTTVQDWSTSTNMRSL